MPWLAQPRRPGPSGELAALERARRRAAGRRGHRFAEQRPRSRTLVQTGKPPLPAIDSAADDETSPRFLEPCTSTDGAPRILGLRDRAIIGIMVFSFARVGAVVGRCVEDDFAGGERWSFSFPREAREAPQGARPSQCRDLRRGRGLRSRKLNGNVLHRVDVFRMIRRRAERAGFKIAVCCHTFRATGITTYLDNGGTIKNAQAIANHELPRTANLDDRTNGEITLGEVERILI